MAACVVCGARVVVEHHPAPAQSTALHTIETLPWEPSAFYRPVSEASLHAELGDDSPHDHREYDPDPISVVEYSTGGGSTATSPFTSVPGLARPGMMSPGRV